MKAGIQISIVYTDEHLIELRIMASNGVFAGQVDVYADSDALTELAEMLRDFPGSQSDSREFEIGSFDAAYAGGGVGFRFYCVDSVGHAAAEVRLRSDPEMGGGVSDTMVVHVPVEAAAIDSFVVQLAGSVEMVGQTARLEAVA